MSIEQPKLNEFAKQVYNNNVKKGFDVAKSNIGQTLMLVVSELSEALEADRKGRHADITKFKQWIDKTHESEQDEYFKGLFELFIKDTFEDEIADAMIRLLDLVGGLDIDIDFHIEKKLEYNRLREYKHGKAY